MRLSPDLIPALVSQRLPEIMVNVAFLAQKSKEERLKVLKDNEKYIEKGANDYESVSDDDDDEGGEETKDGEKMDDDSDKDEKEFKEIKDKLKNFKHKEGKHDEDDDDDDSDSDYEYTGGDLALYDSALEEVDELLFIKETLEGLNQAN